MECKEWTLDPYWQDIFISCAHGKFPRGLKITKEGSILLTKNKQVLHLPQDPFQAFKTMMDIFKTKLGLISDREMRKQHKDIESLKEKYSEYQQSTWKQIKPKNIKIMLITNYVLECKNMYNLSPEKTSQLLSTIKLGFIFKTIKSEDIDYSDGVIHNIDGIEFSDGDFTFDIFSNISASIDGTTVTSDAEISDAESIENCRQVFERYIKDYKNSIIKI